jgi:hypothetical protein
MTYFDQSLLEDPVNLNLLMKSEFCEEFSNIVILTPLIYRLLEIRFEVFPEEKVSLRLLKLEFVSIPLGKRVEFFG